MFTSHLAFTVRLYTVWLKAIGMYRTQNFESNAVCTLLPRELETTRERECRWKHSPRMLPYSLKRSCLASLALTFLVVRDVRVKGSHVSPGCRLVSRTKSKVHGKSVESCTRTILSHATLSLKNLTEHTR